MLRLLTRHHTMFTIVQVLQYGCMATTSTTCCIEAPRVIVLEFSCLRPDQQSVNCVKRKHFLAATVPKQLAVLLTGHTLLTKVNRQPDLHNSQFVCMGTIMTEHARH